LIWEHFKDVLTLLACEMGLALLLQMAVSLFPGLSPLVEKCQRTLEWGAVATISYLIVESIVRMALSLAREPPEMGLE
jgi:hypothetical protein